LERILPSCGIACVGARRIGLQRIEWQSADSVSISDTGSAHYTCHRIPNRASVVDSTAHDNAVATNAHGVSLTYSQSNCDACAIIIANQVARATISD